MKTTSLPLLISLLCAPLLVGCSENHAATGDSTHNEASHTDPHDPHEDEDGLIHIDPDEMDEFGIRTQIAESGMIEKRMSFSGEISLNPDRIAHVVSRAGGIGDEILGTIGGHVIEGQTLAVLESPTLAEIKANYLFLLADASLAATDLQRTSRIHQNTITLLEIIDSNPDIETLGLKLEGMDIGSNRSSTITAYAEMKASEAIFNRETQLVDRKISSEVEYLSAQSELSKARASFWAIRDDLSFMNTRELEIARRSLTIMETRLHAAKRNLVALGLDENQINQIQHEADTDLSRYEIQSPIAGRIIERHLVEGESIESGDQVFMIADLDHVWGKITLYQRDLALVSEGMSVRVIGQQSDSIADVSIEYISPILDETTRTTTARIVLDNTNGQWYPGMFFSADGLVSEHEVGVRVPSSAIQSVDGESVVFVRSGDGFQLRQVAVGSQSPDFVEITRGLLPGEEYVASGALALRVEMNKAALEHAGHAH